MNIGKVIKGLECHQIDNNRRINCADCPYYVDDHIRCVNDLHDDAVALLKDQEEEIENLKQTCQSMIEGVCLLKEREAIVRCKDCKNNNQCSIQFKFADADNPGNWFCAYGKCKEGR